MTPFAPTPGPAQPPPYRGFFRPNGPWSAPRQLIRTGGGRHADRRGHREPEARVPDPRRRARVASVLSAALAGAPQVRLVVDLSGHAPSLFDRRAAELSRLSAEVAAADIAIFASPTYKAAYAGLLKAFLDRSGATAWPGRSPCRS